MENKARATAAGAFVVIMVAMVIATVLWFSQDKTVRIAYEIVTDRSIEGLTPRSPVELYGVSVGAVESVSFIHDRPGFVRVLMMLDESAPVNQSTYATLSTRSVTGSVFVNLMDDINAPAHEREQRLVAASGGVPQISLQAGVLANFAESMQVALSRVDQTLENLNIWLAPENSERFFAAVDSLQHAAQGITALTVSLDQKSAEVLGGVSAAVRNADRAFMDIRTLMLQANQMMETIMAPGGMVSHMEQGVRSLSGAAQQLNDVTLAEVGETVHSVDKAVRTAEGLFRALEEQPQMLIFGNGGRRPGPGEQGYVSPYSSQGSAQ